MRPARARVMIGAALAGVLAVGGMASAALADGPGCSVDYRLSSSWTGGFVADVTVTNLGPAVQGWQLGWTYTAGQRVQNVWNASLTSQSGGQVVLAAADHNRSLGQGGTASLGLVGTSGATNPAPTAFTLNGVVCTGAVAPDPTPTTPAPTPTVTPTTGPTQEPTPEPTATPQPTSGLYVDPTTQAAAAAASATGETRRLLDKIALTPASTWIGSWASAQVSAQQVADYTTRAQAAGRTGVLTIYAIPGRDCGSHSGGGVATSEYAAWVDTVAGAIRGNPIVVLEPDALAQLGDCSGQGDRVGYLRYAARSLTEAGARVYVDTGNSAWLSAEEAARRLRLVGLDHAVGFALNTSNYRTTTETAAYGERVSALVGGAGYVIDTSRNGNGSNGEWCNPRGRALGERPRLVDDATSLDALLWIKLPGESDGACNGGPAAGQWWQEIALELARNASW